MRTIGDIMVLGVFMVAAVCVADALHRRHLLRVPTQKPWTGDKAEGAQRELVGDVAPMKLKLAQLALPADVLAGYVLPNFGGNYGNPWP